MERRVILDTDIGYDPDDLFALLLLLNSPEINIDLIVTGDEVGGKRAVFLQKILQVCGRSDIPVVEGEDLGNSDFVVDELIKGFECSTNKDYLTAMKELMDESQELIYLGISGFTNLANFLKKFPESIGKLKVYAMGGAIGFSRRPGWVEHNIKIDKESARYVLSRGVDISLVMTQTTFQECYEVSDDTELYHNLKRSKEPIHDLLLRHLSLFHDSKGFWSYMHDPLTVSVALGKDFVSFYESGIEMDESGSLSLSTKNPKLKLSHAQSSGEDFIKFLEGRLFKDSTS